MIFKFSGKADSGRGTDAAKRMVTSHLNHRPNQGQKRPGQMDDLRPFIDNKKAKRDADRKSGDKAMDKGKSNQGVSGASQSSASQSGASQSGASQSGASQSGASQSGAGGNTYHYNFYGSVTIQH